MRSIPTGEELEKLIESVRELVKNEQENEGLRCPTTDEFLLRFIKASHYKVNVSFHLIKRYFKAKVENPEAFIVQSPAENLKMLTRTDMGLPLKERDKFGRRVLNVKFGLLDPRKEDWTSVVQTCMMALEAFSLEEDVQDNGVALILDCAGFSLKIMKWATPHKIRITMGFFLDCIPIRFEAVHIINYPYVFNVFYSAVTPLLNEDVKKKFTWHRDLSSLEKYIEKDHLPIELGGKLQQEDQENWYKIVTEREELFAEFRKMGYEK